MYKVGYTECEIKQPTLNLVAYIFCNIYISSQIGDTVQLYSHYHISLYRACQSIKSRVIIK